ncbi:pentapeptide repeat-containing protein [Sphingosinicella sp. CPCC 101087]|uniref:pentapeptide repeat-containing protein n=1 Tax=Sphingosinicella sp. CPCC 101087 TaxID=2497754 RepID=UPI0013EE20F4|nr:pentapeptide repeat-containing protein [Sphingosinicella sp. CPCC 101087]
MALTWLAAASLAAAAAVGQDCQTALGPIYEGAEESALSGQFEGATLDAGALIALRAARGDALIVVKGGDFAGADFRGARLHNVCFLDTGLAGSDWRGADATGIGFVRADLTGARLTGARMPRVLLRRPVMKDVDASGADLSGGRIDGGWDGSLDNLRLDRANLRGFQFDCGISLGDGCPLERAISFRGADLTEASLHTYWGEGGDDWTGARIDRTVVGLHQINDLTGAEFAGPLLVRGGDATAELSAAEHRALVARLRPDEEEAAPSFDCTRASGPVERLICGDQGGRLRALDRVVAGLYARAAAADPGIAAAQRSWLRERDRCADDADAGWTCVEKAYVERREQLIAGIGAPAWARPGAAALFVVPVVDFEETFRDHPLFRRLLPVFERAAWAQVAVRVNGDGSLDVRGDAIGANAHSCSLAADRLRPDPSSGWYSATREAAAEATDPPEWRGRPVPVMLFWDDRGEVYRHGHPHAGVEGVDPRAIHYASCGVRAHFGELVRLPLPAAEATARFESFDSP